MRLPFAPLLLVLPLLEIAVFVIVGRQIGVLPTLGLVALTTILGSVLLKRQGFGALRRIRGEAQVGRVPAREFVDGLMIAVAGILLMLPGFITDVIGLLLFVPAIRKFVWSLLGVRIALFGSRMNSAGGPRSDGGGNPTIDLGSGDYRKTPHAESPWLPKQID